MTVPISTQELSQNQPKIEKITYTSSQLLALRDTVSQTACPVFTCDIVSLQISMKGERKVYTRAQLLKLRDTASQFVIPKFSCDIKTWNEIARDSLKRLFN